jgi:hypothetical protein
MFVVNEGIRSLEKLDMNRSTKLARLAVLLFGTAFVVLVALGSTPNGESKKREVNAQDIREGRVVVVGRFRPSMDAGSSPRNVR